MIAAGSLDRRIMLLRPGPPVGDGNGTRLGELVAAGQRWVSVKLARGAEAIEAEQRDGRRRLSFWLRFDSLTRNIDATWALEHDDGSGPRRYAITGVSAIGRREGIELLASASEGRDEAL